MTPEPPNPAPADPTASEFEPRAGDVILIDHGEGSGPVSSLIRQITESPYSHTILVLGPDRFTDAFEGATGPFVERKADIEIWDTAAGWFAEPTCDLYRLPSARPAPDPTLLENTAREFVKRATPLTEPIEDDADPTVEFNTGDMAGLAVLRGLMLLEQRPDLDPDRRESIVKCRRAAFKVLNKGDTRLFCSEYVYRVLTSSGARPLLGERPFIPVDGYRTDQPGLIELDLFDSIAAWLRRSWEDIMEFAVRLQALPSQALEIGQVLDDIRHAYDDPSPDPILERANFVVPNDFIIDRIHVATRTKERAAWGPPILRPRPPKAG